MATFTIEILINASKEKCFDLARDIDFHKENFASSKEEAIAGVTTGLIGDGESVTFRATHFGIKFTMTSKIVAFSSPNHFRDSQQKGPFKDFKHDHYFEDATNIDGDTLMIDTISFNSPFWIIGKIVDRLFMKRYLSNMITQRSVEIKKAAEMKPVN